LNHSVPSLLRFARTLLRLTWFLLPACALAQTAGAPFTCDVVFYQVRNTAPNSLVVKFASVNSTVTPTAVYTTVKGTQLNALGYNPVDNYMYGLIGTGGTPQLYRVGQTGYELVGTIANSLPGGTSLAAFTPTAGVFDAGGRYYFAGQGGGNLTPAAIFRVDSIPLTGAPQVAHQYNLSPAVVTNFGDFDFNGAGGPDGLLLGAVNTVHYRTTLSQNGSNPALGTASVVATTLAAGGDVGAVGSAFYDAFASRFYVFNNNTNAFWEIVNPQVGIPSAVLTNAAPYPATATPAFPGPYTPTDGTSCPISGSRVADLSITKTDGVGSIPASAVTSYTITVGNTGPYPANYSTVRDPAAAGLNKLSVSCSAPGGPPTAVCPATLTTSTFEAGVQIVTFPPGTTLVFAVTAQATAAVGSNVTNTATITPASDTSDPNLLNNQAVDVDGISGTNTSVVSAAARCPAGTVETYTNRFSNGDFAAAAPLVSAATVGAQNTYNVANSVSRQVGTQSYLGVGIQQNAFSGDAARNVPGSVNWLLSNGKTAGSPNYAVWTQPVTGLTAGRTYEFMAYVSNATRPGTGSPTIPDLRLQVGTGAATSTVATFSPANETVGVGDVWTLVQGTFSSTVTSATLTVANFAAAGSAEPGGGDVAGIAQLALRECAPAADVGVTKTNGTTTIVSTGTTAYTVTVTNPSTVTATNTLIVDPAASNIVKTSITCVVSGANLCPASLSIPGLEGAGLVIPRVAAGGGTVVFVIQVNVTGPPGATATNVVTISGIDYVDSDPTNNQAQDVDLIRGTANLSVAKTNAIGTVTSGTTTSYTVTVSNAGPAVVVNAVLTDPVATGLVCTAVSCTAVIGAASCPAPAGTTIAALQGGGITLPSMGVPSSLTFQVDCNVTATGF
jgi:uncharacterized repeat protein (TIGR01451 family)